MELNKQKEDLMNKDKIILGLRNEFTAKEVEYLNQIENMQTKLEDKNAAYQLLFSKYEIVEKELLDLVRQLYLSL